MVTGRQRVAGTHEHELAPALRVAGLKVRDYRLVPERPTLGEFVVERRRLRARYPVLVLGLPGHWLAVAGDSWLDDSAGTIEPIGSLTTARPRVEGYIAVLGR